VLIVPADELGDPVPDLVHVEAGDRSLHPLQLTEQTCPPSHGASRGMPCARRPPQSEEIRSNRVGLVPARPVTSCSVNGQCEGLSGRAGCVRGHEIDRPRACG
jgi:hypothetical protein